MPSYGPKRNGRLAEEYGCGSTPFDSLPKRCYRKIHRGKPPPASFWSLLDILKPFHMQIMMTFMNILGGQRVHIEWSKVHPPGKGNNVFIDREITAEMGAYDELEHACTELGLTASRATVQRIRAALAKPDSKRTDIISLEVELGGRLLDEMEGRSYFALSLSETEYYERPLERWDTIIGRFPNITTDVEEASKCFALSRYAATVFHSLQIVEVGLIELGRVLVVTDPQTGWNATTKKLNKIMETKHPDRTPFQQQHYQSLEQICATVEALKSAWRNKISHAQSRLVLLTSEFNREIAEEILFASRAFMRRLATDAPTSPDPDA